ncbi:MAG: cupin domain-containing protein [Myxococcota bacterium]
MSSWFTTRDSPVPAPRPPNAAVGVSTMLEKVNLAEKLAQIAEPWRPKVVGELNGQEVKLVKFQGTFVWHHHETEDELFLGVRGRFRLEFRDRAVELGPGEFIIVPRGVEHRTAAAEEVEVLLFEPAGTRNTGNVEDSDFTAPSESGDLGRKHQLHGIQPVLPVADVAASVRYFRDLLGFEIDFLEGDPPVHARVMKGDGSYGDPIYIHLSKALPEEVRPSGELRIHVGHDLDGLFDGYRALGVAVVFPPISQPWGLREFAVREINGHVLRFCAEA